MFGFFLSPMWTFKMMKVLYFTQYFFFLNTQLPPNFQVFINPFREGIWSWIPNYPIANWAARSDCMHMLMFEQNPLPCSFIESMGRIWGLMILFVITKLVVGFLCMLLTDASNNWFMDRARKLNKRMGLAFLWNMLGAVFMPVLLYIYLHIWSYPLEYLNINTYFTIAHVPIVFFYFF